MFKTKKTRETARRFAALALSFLMVFQYTASGLSIYSWAEDDKDTVQEEQEQEAEVKQEEPEPEAEQPQEPEEEPQTEEPAEEQKPEAPEQKAEEPEQKAEEPEKQEEPEQKAEEPEKQDSPEKPAEVQEEPEEDGHHFRAARCRNGRYRTSEKWHASVVYRSCSLRRGAHAAWRVFRREKALRKARRTVDRYRPYIAGSS